MIIKYYWNIIICYWSRVDVALTGDLILNSEPQTMCYFQVISNPIFKYLFINHDTTHDIT